MSIKPFFAMTISALALPLAASAGYFCTIGTSGIQVSGDGSGSGCVLWDGVSAPPAPPAPPSGGGSAPVAAPVSGGGGGRSKDACPERDKSPSYYDRRCDADPSADDLITETSARLNVRLASASGAFKAKVVAAFSSRAASGVRLRVFPDDSRRILESVAAIVAAGTGTAADMPSSAEQCSTGASYADLSGKGVGRKLNVLVSCGLFPQGTVVESGRTVYRAEALEVFAAAFGLRTLPEVAPFADVPASLAPLYKSASLAGMAMPDPDGRYRPSAPLTFADIRRMMLSVGAYSAALSLPDDAARAEYADLVSAIYDARKEKSGAGNK